MKKIIKLLLRNFVNAKIGDLATNLTYVSFISIFPLVAVVMGLSKGFGLDRLLVNRLKEYVPSSETQLNYILEVAEKLINSLNSSVLSGVGLVIILSVSYTHLTLPTILRSCRSRWSPYH